MASLPTGGLTFHVLKFKNVVVVAHTTHSKYEKIEFFTLFMALYLCIPSSEDLQIS